MYNKEYFTNLVKEKFDIRKTLVVAAPHDSETILAVSKAYMEGIIDVVLVGDISKINSAAKNADKDISNFEILEATSLEEIAHLSVKTIAQGKGDILMKGLIDTSILLKALLTKDYNLRTGRLFSHVGIVYKDEKCFVLTDAGMNIAPNIKEKKQIIENSIQLANALGLENPKVAMLCAKEKPYKKMPATTDAQALKEMNEKGEIKGCVVSGPLQLDVAISSHAAKIKGIKDNVAGNADILVVPTIEVGNVFGKALKYLGGYSLAGIVTGAKIPVVLVSRADGEDEKTVSIALACAMINK